MNFKKLALFYCCIVCFIHCGMSQTNDEPYYNNREAYKENAGDIYNFRISTSLSRPFYRDLGLSAEFAIAEDYSMLFGVGVYVPRTYSLKPGSFEDKADMVLSSPGFRILTRGFSYTGRSLDASYGAMEFAYNSLGDVKFLELGMFLGVPIIVVSHVSITPELGFGARMFTRNPYYLGDHKSPVPYIIADITVGYNF